MSINKNEKVCPMSRHSLMRCMASLMVTMFAATLTFGLRSQYVVGAVLGVMIWGEYSEWVWPLPGKASHDVRRDRAHERSKEFLTQFGATPSFIDMFGNGLQPRSCGCPNRFSAGGRKLDSPSKYRGRCGVRTGYYSRDRPIRIRLH